MSDSEDFKRGYREGWNDREDDLIAGIRRVLPPEGPLMSEVEKLVERVEADIARLETCAGYAADQGTPRARAHGRWNGAVAADLRALLRALEPS